MAKRLSIGCQGNHKHTPCMGSQTAAASAYYPQPMCDKVVSAILEKDSEEEVARQIAEAAFIAETAFAGEENEGTGAKKTTEKEEPLNKEERAHVLKWPQMLHQRSGHQPMLNIAKGLQRR